MSRAATVVTVIVLIVILNVVPRVVDLPSVDVSLPSIDVPGWLEWVNRGKNVLVLGLVAVVVIGWIAKELRVSDEGTAEGDQARAGDPHAAPTDCAPGGRGPGGQQGHPAAAADAHAEDQEGRPAARGRAARRGEDRRP